MFNCIIDELDTCNKDLHCKLVLNKNNNVSVMLCNLNREDAFKREEIFVGLVKLLSIGLFRDN